ncbi:MAG: tRNA (cytidine(34)-2'-O)-methyltransferase, partial [Defluviitaleaceae bacterium]|nr:tRNA (cytidine(34)-2'-O)-methyltransferase [Defluviitaleaceae bacterium]
NIVLLEPEIPHNTGAIGRTCYNTQSSLHLIHPLGFFINDKTLLRSGMDYWKYLDVFHYNNFDDFINKNSKATIYLVETGANKLYNEICYAPNDFIIFGKESGGIPKEILERYANHIIGIPMRQNARSLNLSVAVGIVLYEALRQNGFMGLY